MYLCPSHEQSWLVGVKFYATLCRRIDSDLLLRALGQQFLVEKGLVKCVELQPKTRKIENYVR